MKNFYEAFTAIIRNPFLSIVTTLSIAFALIILNIVLGINQLTQERINELSQEVKLTVYIADNVNQDSIQTAIGELENLPEVLDAKYIDAETALQQISERYPDTSSFLKEYDIDNPLPDSVSISTTSPEAQKIVLNYLQQDPFDSYFNIDSKFEERSPIRTIVNNLLKLKNFTSQTILGVIIIFTIGSSLLIFNAIKVTLFNRRKEIQIMQLVGATHGHIRLPFLIEAASFAIIGFLLSLLITYLLPLIAPTDITETTPILSSSSFINNLIKELIALLVIAVVTSYITVNRYLKNRLLVD